MANELTLTVPKAKIGELEAVVGQCNLQAINSYGSFQQAFLMAAGIRSIEKLITDEMMQDIMALQNTTLGFLTDKPAGYSVREVKRFFIEAILSGVRPVGNEFNIIASKVYIAKAGFARLVREYPALTNLKLSPGVPTLIKDRGAIVVYKAEWLLDGEIQQIEREIPVRVNQGMGTDAILGKATRKILAAVYGQLVGSEHALPEGELGEVIDAVPTSRRSELTDKLPPPAESIGGEMPLPDLTWFETSLASAATTAAAQELFDSQIVDHPDLDEHGLEVAREMLRAAKVRLSGVSSLAKGTKAEQQRTLI